ncbi:MAG TPA: NADP-dependent oxidoreductase [Caulobacteraceae bacterium]|jgi:NADPH:quinone reductase-like Zn-dependent oxidoreductase
MKAVRIHRFGGPEVLQVDDIALPVAAHGKLLIRVMAASVNPVDYKIRKGGYPEVAEADLPITLGRDVAGLVETAGGGFEAGDAVYAHLDWADGGYAEYALCAPAGIAAKPSSLDMIQAAAVPLAATTAWQGLFDQGQLKAGERVLIHGASGGVGAFAVQFARIAGAEVIATASAEEADRVVAYGAAQVIDHRAQKFEEVVHDVDLVFDLIGKDTQDRSFQTLKRGGRLISTVQEPDPARAEAAGVTAKRYMATPNAGQLAEIAKLIDSTQVQVTVAKTFTLGQATEAHRMIEEGHPHGKIVLEVAQ